MKNVETYCNDLLAIAKKNLRKDVLEKINLDFEEVIKQHSNNPKILLLYNEFRIVSLTYLPRTRPQVLLGGPVQANFPNLHTCPFFEIADVICLTPENEFPYLSSLTCDHTTLFCDILKKLPQGFVPDFYWDNQVENKHYVPPGIQCAPFPIVASVCHTYFHKSIEHVCELFDIVVAGSHAYVNKLRLKYPNKIINLPFGINWGSFHHFLTPRFDKPIDVCITFVGSTSSFYKGHRDEVIKAAEKFKEKYGHRFVIHLFSNQVDIYDYFDIISKSLIAVNVVSVNGPYNYRTVEAMCAGTMVFQYDWDPEQKFSELFVDGVHGVSFNLDNFESKLLYYLEHQDETKQIIRQAYDFVKEKYSYKKLYQDLIQVVKNQNIELPRKLIKNQPVYHHVDMVYYYQNQMEWLDDLVYGICDEFNDQPWIHYNNRMVMTRILEAETTLGHTLLLALSSEQVSRLKSSSMQELCDLFYHEAKKSVPAAQAWILEWNHLMTLLEYNNYNAELIGEYLKILENCHPEPFDENRIIFKYYINSPKYPTFQISRDEFNIMGLDLLNAIDDPAKRASIHLQYALSILRAIERVS